MAHLLGSKTCIDSLHVDIDDLQNIIHDVIGRTGSIKCHSWKFPDKLATDVDTKELLERYQYGKNQVDNQVSHIVLFEIIIDRLLLVIHGSWHFLHEIQTTVFPKTIDLSSTVDQQTCLSIGLVVKKYWNKLLHIFTILQQHESHRKRSKPTTTTSIQSKSTTNTDQHCQTIETSFSPCSSCTKLQQCLRDHGDCIINLCNLYNLPSSLAHHRCSTTIIPEWLSSDDILHWFESQSKDFDRLSKHLEDLNTTLNKTKNDLDINEKQCKQQTETNRRLQQIINETKQSKKILQESYEKKISEMKNKYDQEKIDLNEQIQLLTTQKVNLEQQLKDLNNQCISNGEQIEKLESTKAELRILKENQLKSDDLIKTLEQDRIRLQTELDVIKRDLDTRTHEGLKDRIRIENMIRQEENCQSKQKTLTKSHEELSHECESLRNEITKLEIERDELQKSLQILQTQNQSLIETNNHVLQEISSLKINIEQLHQQMNEREQILAKYTDLNGHNQTLPTSDNNLIHDMQNQMRTNELRIDLLRKQNDSFKSSLEKFLSTNNNMNLTRIAEDHQDESHRRYSYRNEIVTSKPKSAPLWLLNNEILEQQQQAFTETRPMTTTNCVPRPNENHPNVTQWVRSDSDADIETLRNHSATTISTRLQSTDLLLTKEIRASTVNRSSRTTNNNRILGIPPSSSHSIITDRNRSKTTTTSNRPSTVEHTRRDVTIPKTSAKTQRLSLNVIHRCTNCHTTFDDKRNYDIHKLYCRT